MPNDDTEWVCGETNPRLAKITLLTCESTTIAFAEACFEITQAAEGFRIASGSEDYVLVSQKNQQVPYKANILGGMVADEQRQGDIDYADYFAIDWSDDFSLPQAVFHAVPARVVRRYTSGHRIELGLEEVCGYRVIYRDGVEAHFDRATGRGFTFSFSTGFYGSFEELEDGGYTLTFKGDRLEPGEDDLLSQSKFVISRSKYTGRLLLILQEDATVELKGLVPAS